LGAYDRLGEVRIFADNIAAGIIAGLAAGWFTTVSFAKFAIAAAVIPLILVPVGLYMLRESPTANYEKSAMLDAWQNIKIVASSRAAWAATVFLCLLSAPQSFLSMLYQQQTDVLKLDLVIIGRLDSLAGVSSVICPKFLSAIKASMPAAGTCNKSKATIKPDDENALFGTRHDERPPGRGRHRIWQTKHTTPGYSATEARMPTAGGFDKAEGTPAR
jgi:hypothetical protein